MRPNPGFLNDNSRRDRLTRRGFVVGCAAAFAATAVPTRLSAQQTPKRIVSTAPSITEALFALGLGDRVVGVSRFCNFPAEVQKLPRVGSYLSPDPEAIARLVPDLVVLQRVSSQLTERLNALGIRYIEVPHGTLNDVYTGIVLIGKAAATPDRAAALNARIQGDLAAVQARAKQLPVTRVLVVLNRRPGTLTDFTADGPGNYVQQLLQIAGGQNVLDKPGLPTYPRISLETVLREDPDMILDLSGESESETERQAASAQVLKLWQQQGQLKAVRNGRVVVGVSNALLVPGPRAAQAATMLFDFMHGSGKGV